MTRASWSARVTAPRVRLPALRGTQIIVRTPIPSGPGYTGSPGYEIYLDAADTESAFCRLLEAGESSGVVPAGLGARDTLRLEAALPLYGHELDEDTSPLQAGLGPAAKACGLPPGDLLLFRGFEQGFGLPGS